MAEVDAAAVWRVLPARMPGMVPPVVAARFAGVPVDAVVRVLEAMVVAGTAIRRHRRGHDVYYRGIAPAAPIRVREDEEVPLWI